MSADLRPERRLRAGVAGGATQAGCTARIPALPTMSLFATQSPIVLVDDAEGGIRYWPDAIDAASMLQVPRTSCCRLILGERKR